MSLISLEANDQLRLQVFSAGKIAKMLSQKLCLIRVLLETNTKIRRTVMSAAQEDEGQDDLGELWEVNVVTNVGVDPDTTNEEELIADFPVVLTPYKQYGTSAYMQSVMVTHSDQD